MIGIILLLVGSMGIVIGHMDIIPQLKRYSNNGVFTNDVTLTGNNEQKVITYDSVALIDPIYSSFKIHVNLKTSDIGSTFTLSVGISFRQNTEFLGQSLSANVPTKIGGTEKQITIENSVN